MMTCMGDDAIVVALSMSFMYTSADDVLLCSGDKREFSELKANQNESPSEIKVILW